MAAMRVLFVTRYDERGASSRCRVYQYLPHLNARGIESEVVSWMPSAAELWQRAGEAEAVFLQKRVPTLAQLFLLRKRTPRLFFDFDDAIWLCRRRGGAVGPAGLRTRLRLPATLRLADVVVAGNTYLAAYARRWNPRVVVLPTPVDVDYYTMGCAASRGAKSPAAVRAKGHGAVCLGWVGDRSNLCYLRRLEPVLARLTCQYAELSLRVICSEPYASDAIPVENVRWSLADEVANLQGIDIGLMPLDDDPWTRGKCGYKALQYMAAGVPAVCSPVGMNAEIVTDGENGLLAEGPDAWERQLSRLIASPSLRQGLGAAGRRSVERTYSLSSLAPRLADLLGAAGQEVSSRERDVCHVEASLSQAEPYGELVSGPITRS
jgi:hypothetical protein